MGVGVHFTWEPVLVICVIFIMKILYDLCYGLVIHDQPWCHESMILHLLSAMVQLTLQQ